MDARLHESLVAVARSHRGLQLAVLFGSSATGRTHDGSDVDIAVMLDSDVSTADELALHEAFARVAARDVDLVRLEDANVILRNRVAREGVLLFEQKAGLFAHFAADAALEYLEMEPLLLDARKRFLRRVAGTP